MQKFFEIFFILIRLEPVELEFAVPIKKEIKNGNNTTYVPEFLDFDLELEILKKVY